MWFVLSVVGGLLVSNTAATFELVQRKNEVQWRILSLLLAPEEAGAKAIPVIILYSKSFIISVREEIVCTQLVSSLKHFDLFVMHMLRDHKFIGDQNSGRMKGRTLL
jgi:hypothetical protein